MYQISTHVSFIVSHNDSFSKIVVILDSWTITKTFLAQKTVKVFGLFEEKKKIWLGR